MRNIFVALAASLALTACGASKEPSQVNEYSQAMKDCAQRDMGTLPEHRSEDEFERCMDERGSEPEAP